MSDEPAENSISYAEMFHPAAPISLSAVPLLNVLIRMHHDGFNYTEFQDTASCQFHPVLYVYTCQFFHAYAHIPLVYILY